MSEDNTREFEAQIRAKIAKYLSKSPYTLNPDSKIVDSIFEGLAKRKAKFGAFYCPCRVLTGNKEEDTKKICLCWWHKDEIKKSGKCHCGLLVEKSP